MPISVISNHFSMNSTYSLSNVMFGELYEIISKYCVTVDNDLQLFHSLIIFFKMW